MAENNIDITVYNVLRKADLRSKRVSKDIINYVEEKVNDYINKGV